MIYSIMVLGLLHHQHTMFVPFTVSHHCFTPPAADIQWEPRPEGSSPSSLLSLLFNQPSRLSLVFTTSLEERPEGYLIHCFLPLNNNAITQ